ncbi:MAG: riboflavin synthase, partial [Thermoleophilia bacterium]|nr:riboflavin synthase [Thermoleophilia bacterium]
MFTGIIRSLGSVVDVGSTNLTIDAPGVVEELGASIAIDGCCLTVTSHAASPVDLPLAPDGAPVATIRYTFDILPETVSHTRFGELETGSPVNLEPALRAGQPLGGHLVQGHVDGIGNLRSRGAASDDIAVDMWFDLPAEILTLCIDRGSITINGISLTVMEPDATGVRVQLIPETQQRTNPGRVPVGSQVNLEADVIARYVARLLAT